MRKELLLGVLALSLATVSCSKDIDAPVSSIEEGYTEVVLNLSGENINDQARSLFYEENGLVKFQFDNSLASRVNVKTAIFSGSDTEPLYETRLMWTVSSDGKTLTLKSSPVNIKIPDPKKELRVYAIIDGPATDDGLAIQELKPGQKATIKVPLVMDEKLKIESVSGKKVLTMDSPSTAKFKPRGTLMELVIQNNMVVPTIAMGVKVSTGGFSSLTLDKKGKMTLQPANTQKVYGFNTNVGKRDTQQTVVVKPKSKNENRLLLWMPLTVAQNIGTVEVTGPAKGIAVRSKTPSKEGQLIKYTVTVEPGSGDFPMYTSSLGMVQYHVNTDAEKIYFSLADEAAELANYQKIFPNAYIPAGDQMVVYSPDNRVSHSSTVGLNTEYQVSALRAWTQFEKDGVVSRYSSQYYNTAPNEVYSVSYRKEYGGGMNTNPLPKRMIYKKNTGSVADPAEYSVSFMDYDPATPNKGLKPEDWNGSNVRTATFSAIGYTSGSLAGTNVYVRTGTRTTTATSSSPNSYWNVYTGTGSNGFEGTTSSSFLSGTYPMVFFTKNRSY